MDVTIVGPGRLGNALTKALKAKGVAISGPLKKGDTIATLSGPMRQMLAAERTAREGEDTAVVGSCNQRLDQQSADHAAGSRDQRNSGSGTHAAKLNKQTSRCVPRR